MAGCSAEWTRPRALPSMEPPSPWCTLCTLQGRVRENDRWGRGPSGHQSPNTWQKWGQFVTSLLWVHFRHWHPPHCPRRMTQPPFQTSNPGPREAPGRW